MEKWSKSSSFSKLTYEIKTVQLMTFSQAELGRMTYVCLNWWNLNPIPPIRKMSKQGWTKYCSETFP